MATYSTTAHSYLARASAQLAAGTQEALFYAALELRCGVEARMRDYLEYYDHVPIGKKKEWRIAVLGKAIDTAFSGPPQVARVRILDKATLQERAVYFYTPVSPTLQSLAERLGDYLHSQKLFRPSADPWWDEFRNVLGQAIALLTEATFGSLLGPPLRHTSTGKTHLPMEVPLDHDPTQVADLGEEIVIDIAYFESLTEACGGAA